MPANDERRKQPRRRADKKLMIKIMSSPDRDNPAGMSVLCLAVDISSAGIRLLLDRALPADTELEVWLKPTGAADPLVLPGVTRWSNDSPEEDAYWVGVEFLSPPAEAKAVWDRLFPQSP